MNPEKSSCMLVNTYNITWNAVEFSTDWIIKYQIASTWYHRSSLQYYSYSHTHRSFLLRFLNFINSDGRLGLNTHKGPKRSVGIKTRAHSPIGHIDYKRLWYTHFRTIRTFRLNWLVYHVKDRWKQFNRGGSPLHCTRFFSNYYRWSKDYAEELDFSLDSKYTGPKIRKM